MAITAAFQTLLRNTVPPLWGGLLNQDPITVQDPLTVELVSRVYSRTEAYNGSVWFEMIFFSIPAGSSIAAVGFFDAPINGSMRFARVFPEPYIFAKGGSMTFSAAGLSLKLGVAS